MKRIMPALLLPALLFAAGSAPAWAADKHFTITDFDRIQVEGPYEVALTSGKAPSAHVTGNARAIENVAVEVQGRILKIRLNRSAWGGYPGETNAAPRVIITTPGLRSASVAGSGRLTIDKVKAMRFDISLSGSGQVALGSVEADVLVLGLVGSGGMEVGGKAKSLRASVQGSGNLDGRKLSVDDAVIIAETTGTVELTARRTAKIRATGQGDTLVAGEAACTVEALGSGRVQCGD
ncbi:MAG: DUF2807 domain-containing protein [Sphingosinicella sp.]|nr:DUF2807 domain-containing protein [Sphingosinicella sp.]